MPVLIWKEIGETPLEALERYRAAQVAVGRADLAGASMTYAGRLDPMAEGQLLILIGDECSAETKARWLGLDKEYEVEIVFGIETDTHDALGLAKKGAAVSGSKELQEYVGRFVQEYPAYSSKMFSWKGDEPPTKEVEIYSIEPLEESSIGTADLKARIFGMVDRVKGDFRQDEIKRRWEEVLKGDASFSTRKIRVRCSSGTYMRSLAHRMGSASGRGAFALAIRRTKIIY